MRKLALTMALIGSVSLSNAQTDKNTAMYPLAKEGFERVEIYVPEQKNESDYKVEITVGKNTEVDNCNRFFLMGTLQEETVKGWGYTYYEFNSNGDVAGTLMGCPDNKKVEKFITAQSELLRYNSKLPIVVYVPKGMEVKYRIWEASSKEWQEVK